MKDIDFDFFTSIEATHPDEGKRPLLKWCNCYFGGVKREYIEIEFMMSELFDPSKDLFTEQQIEAMNDDEALKYVEIYEVVNISSDSLLRKYSLENQRDANVYFIEMDLLIRNLKSQLIMPSGYYYDEEFDGKGFDLIFTIE